MEIFERLVDAAAHGRNKILSSHEVRWLVALIKGMDEKLGALQNGLMGAEMVVQAYVEKFGDELLRELMPVVDAEVVEDAETGDVEAGDGQDHESGGVDSPSQEEE